MNKSTKDKDLEFLVELDKQVHYVSECARQANMSGSVMRFSVDRYHDVVMTPDAVENLLRIVRSKDLLFYPINTNFGFSVGFCVASATKELGADADIDVLLIFKEGQLPPAYDFDRLSKTFLGERNLELMRHFGLEEPVVDRIKYDY